MISPAFRTRQDGLKSHEIQKVDSLMQKSWIRFMIICLIMPDWQQTKVSRHKSFRVGHTAKFDKNNSGCLKCHCWKKKKDQENQRINALCWFASAHQSSCNFHPCPDSYNTQWLIESLDAFAKQQSPEARSANSKSLSMGLTTKRLFHSVSNSCCWIMTREMFSQKIITSQSSWPLTFSDKHL